MPLNFLFGSLVLGGKALKDVQKAQNHKAAEEAYQLRKQMELEAGRKRYEGIQTTTLAMLQDNIFKATQQNCEVPLAFMKGGTLWFCENASSIDEVIEIARNKKVSYVDPQPRWRLAKVNNFQAKYDHYRGVAWAGYYMTVFYFAERGEPLSREERFLIKQMLEEFGYQYGRWAYGTADIPECMKREP